jgi:hypothetical protein
MARHDGVVTLDEVLALANQLSAIDKVRLIERVAPDVEHELAERQKRVRRSLLGLLKDLGPAPSEQEIDAARRDAWTSFPRDDV